MKCFQILKMLFLEIYDISKYNALETSPKRYFIIIVVKGKNKNYQHIVIPSDPICDVFSNFENTLFGNVQRLLIQWPRTYS